MCETDAYGCTPDRGSINIEHRVANPVHETRIRGCSFHTTGYIGMGRILQEPRHRQYDGV